MFKKSFFLLLTLFTFLICASSLHAQILPDVYITDFVTDKTSYNIGDTVTGHFSIYNDDTEDATNLSYNLSLASDYFNDVSSTEINVKSSSGLIIKSQATEGFSFSYPLTKLSVIAPDTKLKLRILTANGQSLAWSDADIQIKGGASKYSVEILNPTLSIGDRQYTVMQYGPMIYPGDKPTLSLQLKNSSKSPEAVIAKYSYFLNSTTDVNNKALAESEQKITLKSSETSTLKVDVPVFSYQPGVYVGKVSFFDQSGNQINGDLEFRYLIYGDVVNIKNVSADQSILKKGDMFNLNISYTGSPFDPDTGKAPSSTPVTLSVKVFTGNNVLVAEYNKEEVLNENTKVINLKSNANANGLSSEIMISKDGKIITTYNSVLSKPSEVLPVSASFLKQNKEMFVSIILIIIVGILLTLAAILVFRKKISTKILFVVLPIVIILLVSLFYIMVYAATAYPGNYNVNSGTMVTKFSLPLPTSKVSFTPNQPFTVRFSSTITVCTNTAQGLQVYLGNATSVKPTKFSNLPLVLSESSTKGKCTGQNHIFCKRTYPDMSFRLIAPSQPGIYYIPYRIYSQYRDFGAGGTSQGYRVIVVTDNDKCSNLAGIQSTIPEGMKIDPNNSANCVLVGYSTIASSSTDNTSTTNTCGDYQYFDEKKNSCVDKKCINLGEYGYSHMPDGYYADHQVCYEKVLKCSNPELSEYNGVPDGWYRLDNGTCEIMATVENCVKVSDSLGTAKANVYGCYSCGGTMPSGYIITGSKNTLEKGQGWTYVKSGVSKEITSGDDLGSCEWSCLPNNSSNTYYKSGNQCDRVTIIEQ